MALSYAYSILGDYDLAEDARQEAFIGAYCDLMALRTPAAFPGWLRQIVRKHAIELVRRRRLSLVPLDEAPEPVDGERRIDEVLEERERLAEARAAIERLPESEREPVRLYYLEGMPLGDIARRLGLPLQTVKKSGCITGRVGGCGTGSFRKSRIQWRGKRTQARIGASRRRRATRTAIEHFDRELADLLAFSDTEGRQRAGELICAKGRLQRFLGRIEEALSTFQGIGIPTLGGDPLYRARMEAEIGPTLVQVARYAEARHHLLEPGQLIQRRRAEASLIGSVQTGWASARGARGLPRQPRPL